MAKRLLIWLLALIFILPGTVISAKKGVKNRKKVARTYRKKRVKKRRRRKVSRKKRKRRRKRRIARRKHRRPRKRRVRRRRKKKTIIAKKRKKKEKKQVSEARVATRQSTTPINSIELTPGAYLAPLMKKSHHRKMRVNSNYGFLREKPSLEAKKLKRLRLNTKVTYLNDSAKWQNIENLPGVWVQVRVGRTIGWFFSGYLDFEATPALLKKSKWKNQQQLDAQIRFNAQGFKLERLGQNSDQGSYQIINGRIHLKLAQLNNSNNRKYQRLRCAYRPSVEGFEYMTKLYCNSGRIIFWNSAHPIPRGQQRNFDELKLVTTDKRAINLQAETVLYKRPDFTDRLMLFKDGFTSENSLRYSGSLVKVRVLARSVKKVNRGAQSDYWYLIALPVSTEGVTEFNEDQAFIFGLPGSSL